MRQEKMLAAPAVVLALLGILSGCGSGGAETAPPASQTSHDEAMQGAHDTPPNPPAAKDGGRAMKGAHATKPRGQAMKGEPPGDAMGGGHMGG